jgi:hypothetical protein
MDMNNPSRLMVLDFKKNIEVVFADRLSKYKFNLEVEHLYGNSAGIYFVKPNDQYIYFALNVDQRDGPPFASIYIGFGPVKDASWNTILLSDYAKNVGKIGVRNLYKIDDFVGMSECAKQMLCDLENAGEGYLKGEVLPAIKAISERAKRLEPYTIHNAGSGGHYGAKIDPQSLEKINHYKNLYSKFVRSKRE